jgi:hypothetical protein
MTSQDLHNVTGMITLLITKIPYFIIRITVPELTTHTALAVDNTGRIKNIKLAT